MPVFSSVFPFLLELNGCFGHPSCMSKSLSEDQIATLRKWAEDGLDLNGIQKALTEQLGIHMTYMDTRFLLLDLGIELRSPAEAAPAADAAAQELPQTISSGQLKVTIDEVKQPGVFLSGQVTFPTGARATWLIDARGSVSWDPILGEPSEEDLNAFQKELGHIIRTQLGRI